VNVIVRGIIKPEIQDGRKLIDLHCLELMQAAEGCGNGGLCIIVQVRWLCIQNTILDTSVSFWGMQESLKLSKC
jgi:hypothetical protein